MPPLGKALQSYYWKCCSQMKASWLWGRIFWGLAKASGVNGLALLCVVLKEWYIAQCWCFISIMTTKIIVLRFCTVISNLSAIMFTWQRYCDNLDFGVKMWLQIFAQSWPLCLMTRRSWGEKRKSTGCTLHFYACNSSQVENVYKIALF